MTKVLIIEARFYQDISDALFAGAADALSQAGVAFDRVSVPGALEIPAVISMAIAGGQGYDGYVALGCVIRGETTHYDYVCGESARGLQDLAVQHHVAIGNGILTVENDDQAWDRADKNRKNKGGGAAEACLRMIEIRQKFLTGKGNELHVA